MDILESDFKKGKVRLRIIDLDDLWYLSNLIDEGDLVKGKTTRKLKIGSEDQTTSIKKTITLKLKVEKIEFHKYQNSLRVSGRVIDGPEDVPNGSYHTLSLEENSDFILEKNSWLNYQKEKLIESSEKRNIFLICVLDREEVLFSLSKRQGTEKILQLTGEVPKKGKEIELKKEFYSEIIKLLIEYNSRYQPEGIVLASPAFFKEDLFKQITDVQLRKKIVLATCSSVSDNAITEVMKSPELQTLLKKSRVRQELMLVEELLSEINKNNLAVYGFVEVTRAVESKAVHKLLIGDFLIQEWRRINKYSELDHLMKQVDASQGEVHIISGEHDGGKKLKGIGGIGALLRYSLNYT